jgi:hypothetical protein
MLHGMAPGTLGEYHGNCYRGITPEGYPREVFPGKGAEFGIVPIYTRRIRPVKGSWDPIAEGQ